MYIIKWLQLLRQVSRHRVPDGWWFRISVSWRTSHVLLAFFNLHLGSEVADTDTMDLQVLHAYMYVSCTLNTYCSRCSWSSFDIICPSSPCSSSTFVSCHHELHGQSIVVSFYWLLPGHVMSALVHPILSHWFRPTDSHHLSYFLYMFISNAFSFLLSVALIVQDSHP